MVKEETKPGLSAKASRGKLFASINPSFNSLTLIYRPIHWLYRAVSGLWYWSHRRFTLAGLMVLGGLVVAAPVSSDMENTVAYQSVALLLGVLLASLASSFFFRAKFAVTRFLPRFGTAGQPLRYRVRINNLTRKMQAGLTLLEVLPDARPDFRQWLAFQKAERKRVRPFSFMQRRRNPFRKAIVKEAEISVMPANGEGEAQVEILPLRRGILSLSGVAVARPDPLGLFRSWKRVAVPQSVLILPKRYPAGPIALPGAWRYQQGGVSLAANVGQSEEFVALREYRHGDPMKHIHWRSWAKTGKPIVKEFEDEFFVRHALVLDTFNSEPNSEVLEEVVSVAASFACTVLTQESLLDLLFVGNESYCFTAGRGLAQTDQMLEILASVQNCADKKFEMLAELVLNHVSAVSGCICVLQRWDEPRQQFVRKLRALGVPLLALVVTQPGEATLDAGPMRDDPGNFHVLEMGKLEQYLANLK
jgi:uncharacterized protein (DUF58 family)